MNILNQTMIQFATNELNVTESGGNNRGSRILEYQKASWLDKPEGTAWCASFLCWCMREAIYKLLASEKGREQLRYIFKCKIATTALAKRCRDASAFGWEHWARANKFSILYPNETKAEAGDIVVFIFSHIGIVEKNQITANTIETIEGNTNTNGTRDSSTGDRVMRKYRDVKSVKLYIRIN